MIKFIEHNDKKLKFVSYPLVEFINYFILLFLFIPLLYWGLYLSPIHSSLTCQKTFFARIDCQLEEKSLLNPHLKEIDIKNVKKVGTHFPGSKDSRIIIKANPHPPYLHINRYQKTYFYPSNPFSLILWRNFNPLNWFGSPNQNKQLDDFLRGKLNRSILQLELAIKGADYLIIGFFFSIPLLFIFNIFYWLIASPVANTYEINLVNKSLTRLNRRLLLKNTVREYPLDKIENIKLEIDDTNSFSSGRITFELLDNNYLLDEFINAEEGKRNFQIIKGFIAKNSNSV